MNLGNGGFPISWVDFVAVALLVVGFILGRKRGLSQEILPTIQWILIVVLGALYYRQLATWMNQKPMFSLLTYYILSYLSIALGLKIIFTLIKYRLGQKLIEGGFFGGFEYYGGMLAGAVKFSCIFVALISMLHAPYYSPEYLAKRAKEVDYNYGSDFFPSIDQIQAAVYKDSFAGRSSEKYVPQLLIVQIAGEEKKVRTEDSLGRRNERKIDAVLNRR